jgi:hypothetical protein
MFKYNLKYLLLYRYLTKLTTSTDHTHSSKDGNLSDKIKPWSVYGTRRFIAAFPTAHH